MKEKPKIDKSLLEKARKLQFTYGSINSVFLSFKLKITIPYAEQIINYLDDLSKNS